MIDPRVMESGTGTTLPLIGVPFAGLSTRRILAKLPAEAKINSQIPRNSGVSRFSAGRVLRILTFLIRDSRAHGWEPERANRVG